MRDLYAAYPEWAREAGVTLAQQQASVRRILASLGFEVRHGNRGDKVFGLSLRSRDAER